MGLRGTRVQLARAYNTWTLLEVQEVEARVRFRGSHYVYWNLQYLTSYQGDPPTDSSGRGIGVHGGFRLNTAVLNRVDGTRPSPPGIFCDTSVKREVELLTRAQ